MSALIFIDINIIVIIREKFNYKYVEYNSDMNYRSSKMI